MFNFRKKDANAPLPPASGPVDTIDALRKRARHRLIGSAILVVLGFSTFALLFDTQPRAVAIDIPIEIPDKLTAKPLAMPAISASASESTPAPAASSVRAVDPVAATVAAPVAPQVGQPVVQKAKAPEPAKTMAPEDPKRLGSTGLAAGAVAPATVSINEADKTKRADSDRAKALLEGGTATKPVENERFIVQFGAFSDAGKARETRQTVEKSGLKTYAQEAIVDGAKRIRVRVGPFATRAEAEKAAASIKALGLPAAILTL